MDLASSFAELGDIERAAQIDEEVFSDLVILLGENHPHTLACAANLALDLRGAGNVSRASELTTETVERYRQVLGNDHPDVKAVAERQRLDLSIDLHATF